MGGCDLVYVRLSHMMLADWMIVRHLYMLLTSFWTLHQPRLAAFS